MKLYSKYFMLTAIPLLTLLYCSVLVCQFLMVSKTEIFPFFSWSLFSKPVKTSVSYKDAKLAKIARSEKTYFRKNYIEIVRIDGTPIAPKTLLISTGEQGIDFYDRLMHVKHFCENNDEKDCQLRASTLFSSTFNDIYFEHEIQFNSVQCFIDVDDYLNLLKDHRVKFPKWVNCVSETRSQRWTINK